MALSAEALREVYLLATDELLHVKSRLHILKAEQEMLAKRAAKYTRWKHESSDVICSTCDGEGTVLHQYAQDDIKRETCTTCKGTGLA